MKIKKFVPIKYVSKVPLTASLSTGFDLMEVGRDEVTLRTGKQANKRNIQFAHQALLALFGKLTARNNDPSGSALNIYALVIMTYLFLITCIDMTPASQTVQCSFLSHLWRCFRHPRRAQESQRGLQ